jgi:hypothetical protein
MAEDTLEQLFAELIEAQGQALGIVVTALCHQVDPRRLTADLHSQLSAAKQLHSTSPVAIQIATTAMAAAEAQAMLQARPPADADRPRKG